MSDPLITMQSDLKRALEKSDKDRRWAMIIDLRKCVGCHACTVGCMAENVTGPNVHYRPVFESEAGKYPNTKRTWTPRPCMQCAEPACTSVCPADATMRSLKGVSAGVVTIDYDKCIGCGSCIDACPYGSRTLDEGGLYTESTPVPQQYETRKFYEYGSEWTRAGGAMAEKARKCHFCLDRIKNGALPICVTTCIGRATYFGDINDTESFAAKILKNNKTTQAKAVENSVVIFADKPATKPSVYYIV